MSVGVNNFVRRQVEGSGKTYSPHLSFEEIAKYAEKQLAKDQFYVGYRDGVIIIKVDKKLNKNFVCPFVKIKKNTILESSLVQRQPREEKYIQTVALNGVPLKTGNVELILYRKDVLAENNESSTNEDWELISINAIPLGVEKLPIGPITMMRNQLDIKGGTKAEYSSAEWAESVQFWQQYAPLKQ
jgi:hypothetical protein